MGGRWASGWRAALSGRGDRVMAGLIAAGTMALLLATLDDYGMAWDEGFTVEREERLREWFGRVFAGDDRRGTGLVAAALEAGESGELPSAARVRGPTRPGAGSRSDYYWQFARRSRTGTRRSTPCWGWRAGPSVIACCRRRESYRFGPAALFALTVGAVYATMVRPYGRAAGVDGRDGPARPCPGCSPTRTWRLTTCRRSASGSWPPRRSSGRSIRRSATAARWAWLGRLRRGLGLRGGDQVHRLVRARSPWPPGWSSTATGGPRGRWRCGMVVAAAVVYATEPDLVGRSGLRASATFLQSNLTRETAQADPDPVLRPALPLLAPLVQHAGLDGDRGPSGDAGPGPGSGSAGSSRAGSATGVGTLLLVCWAFFMVLRALPNAPGHDGVRLFLAGVRVPGLPGRDRPGGDRSPGSAGSPGRGLRAVVGVAVLIAAVGAGAWSTWRYHPLATVVLQHADRRPLGGVPGWGWSPPITGRP